MMSTLRCRGAPLRPLGKYTLEKHILEKYTLEKYTLGKYTLEKYTLEKYKRMLRLQRAIHEVDSGTLEDRASQVGRPTLPICLV